VSHVSSQKLIGYVTCGLSSLAVVMAGQMSQANAASMSFTIGDFTGADTQVKFTLDDQLGGTGNIQFKVDYLATGKNTLADIRGVFFDIFDDSLLSGLKVTGANVTASQFGPADSVTSVGSSNNNLSGGKSSYTFDAGIEIGKEGIADGDDFQTTTFTLSHISQALNLTQFSAQSFGVRLMSVGDAKSREDSSKLVGQTPSYTPTPAPAPAPAPTPAPTPSPTPSPTTYYQPSTSQPQPKKVPEPSTLAALSLFGLSTFRLKKKNQENNSQA
jgi:hypothetical protein